MGLAMLPFFFNMIVSWVRGTRAAGNPWSALSLEWQTTSPPPPGNFATPPIVTHGPYEYGQPWPPILEDAPAR